MTNWLRTVLLIMCLMASPFARAVTTCSGPINDLHLNTNGTLYVDVGHGVWAICAMSTSMGGVDPATCRAWYAGLLAAQKTGHAVTLYLSSGTCATIGSWVVVTPNLYHLNLHGA